MNLKYRPIGFILLALTMAIGCEPVPQAETSTEAKVTGRLTIAGEPLVKAKIVFLPEKLRNQFGSIIPMYYGQSDDEGRFSLATEKGANQVDSGIYRVIVSRRSKQKTEGNRLVRIAVEFDGLLPKDLELFGDKMLKDEQVPALYNENTILSYEVPVGATNCLAEFDLEM